MKFRTELTSCDSPKNLSPESLVLLVGSCFSDYMGARMVQAGWPAVVNPCGVVYNPVSMALLFQLAMTHRAVRRDIVASSLTMREGRFASWLMGSAGIADTEEGCMDKVCECIDRLEEGIEKASAVVLTFGTSDVWLLKDSDRAVGNCHKHPAAEFERKRAGIDEIVSIWKELIEAMRMPNPGLEVVLTVSPRRYLSDGFAENSRQKAVLILACERLCREAETLYFPAYEILNDDLRDYRFYAKDLLHPSEMAIDYIWDKFTQAYLGEEGLLRLREMEKQARRRSHIANR